MKIYWGIYCQAHWYDITAEMLRCIRAARFSGGIEIHATGPAGCKIELLQLLGLFDVMADVKWHSHNQFELPAIRALWRAARANPAGKTCYIHSKGVTSPCPTYSKWRWMMETLILLDIADRDTDLESFDVVGPAYKADWNCFAGNWWCARNSWLASLPAPSLRPNRFALEKWVLQGCGNFKELAKRCSGGWPNFPGEPCSSAYYNGVEPLYRPALIHGLPQKFSESHCIPNP